MLFELFLDGLPGLKLNSLNSAPDSLIFTAGLPEPVAVAVTGKQSHRQVTHLHH